jgi:outer membrane protein assembly factor BamB
LYALTNLGALAAIDAYSGTIVWLNIYPRPKPDFSEMRGRWNRAELPGAAAKPWHHNPVMVKDGRVFILPSDAQHLLVYDAGSGVELKRIRTADFENAKTLLAVAGDRMVLCSDRSVFCLNWQGYTPQTPRDANLFWYAPFQKQGYKANDTIRGRGFVTSDSVFVPTAWALFRLSLKSGRIEQSYPRDRIWDAGEGPGNVLVTQDHVVLATSDRVNVYTDLAMARARLDAGVEARPNDPEPRLRYAEMMFVSNQLDVALTKLDEAMSLLGHGDAAGGGTMRPGPARDRVFSIALTFAQKLADPETNKPEEGKLAEQLFDRAGAAANSPAQQVTYRMTRARFAEPADRVRLYQEVLANDEFRSVPYASSEDQGTAQAETVAENAIREIIGTTGRDVYAPFDAEAAEAMKRAGADPDALRAVARSFPNAKVAPEAMVAAAEAYEAAGNPRRATQMLNEAYRRYRSVVDPSNIIEAQVRNYLKLPDGVGTAIGRLAQAPKTAKLRKPLTMPDGSTVKDLSFAEVAQALHRFNSIAAAGGLPDFQLADSSKRDENGKRIKPLRPEEPSTAIPDVDMLVVPRRDFARHDHVITWTANKGLAIYPVGQTNPVGSHVAFTDTPRSAAWVDADRVLVWSAGRVTLLSAKTGAAVWETVLKNLGVVEIAAAGETVVDALPPGANEAEAIMIERRAMNVRLRAQQGRMVGNVVIGGALNVPGADPQPQQQGPGEQIDQVRLAGDRAIVTTTIGRIVGLDLSAGKPAWQTRVVEGPITQLIANDDFTVARFSDPAAAQIAVLDTFSGQPVGPRRVFPVENARQPVNMALSPDGTLVWTTPGQLCGKYLFEPDKKLNFQVPEQPDNNPRYLNATLPDQLVIANGQILVVTDNGQYVRVHTLEDGKPSADSKPLSTGTQGPVATLRTLGSRVYVIHPKGAVSYNLDRPAEDNWGPGFGIMQPTPAVREAMIGQDYLVLLDQLTGGLPNPNPAAGQPVPGRQAYRLLGYSRAAIKRDDGQIGESGRLDCDSIIKSPAGISTEWQGVNGGFYYRALDRTVHFLRGARE